MEYVVWKESNNTWFKEDSPVLTDPPVFTSDINEAHVFSTQVDADNKAAAIGGGTVGTLK